MIRYSLKCDKDHAFESWFASAEAFDKLKAAGMVACAVCGSGVVEKALMAPAVRAERAPDRPADPAPADAAQEALAAMRRAVEEHSDYVGDDFATEARAMHAGEARARSIWGEARPEEARALIEDGIPVAPLPFIPSRKTN